MRLLIVSLLFVTASAYGSEKKCGSLVHGSHGGLYFYVEGSYDEKIVPLNADVDSKLTRLNKYDWVCVQGTALDGGGDRLEFSAFAVVPN